MFENSQIEVEIPSLIDLFQAKKNIYSCAQNKPTFSLIMKQSWCQKIKKEYQNQDY